MFVGDADGITQLSSRAAQMAAARQHRRQRARPGLLQESPSGRIVHHRRSAAKPHERRDRDCDRASAVVIRRLLPRRRCRERGRQSPGAILARRDDARERRLARARGQHDPRALSDATRATRARRRRQSALPAAPQYQLGLFDAAPQSFDGIARRIGFRKLTPFPVYIIYAVAEANILGQWYPIAGAFGGIAAAASAGLLFASFAVIRRARGEAAALSRAEATALALSRAMRRSARSSERRRRRCIRSTATAASSTSTTAGSICSAIAAKRWSGG